MTWLMNIIHESIIWIKDFFNWQESCMLHLFHNMNLQSQCILEYSCPSGKTFPLRWATPELAFRIASYNDNGNCYHEECTFFYFITTNCCTINFMVLICRMGCTFKCSFCLDKFRATEIWKHVHFQVPSTND